MNIVAVALGGFIGAVLRYLCSIMLGRLTPQGRFPWIILTINGVGCFVFGVTFSMVEDEFISLFLFTGILGAFTTFSTFSVEAIQLWQRQAYVSFILYLALSLVGGTLLFTVGYLFL